MAHKTGAKGNNRNFGLNSPGKGDKDRTSDRKEFVKNYDNIKFTGVEFVKRNNKLIKKYL